MMLGARTGAWAKAGGWVNPYATEGLVAMWDGEWNAGGGVHDHNATTWKDLVGNLTAQLVGNSRFAEGKYCEIMGKSGGTYVNLSNFILPSPPNTIEIVIGWKESSSSYNRFLSNNSFKLYPRSDIGYEGSGKYVPCLNAYGVDTYNYGSRFRRDLNADYTPYAICMAIGDNECNWYLNGDAHASTPISKPSETPNLVIGADNNGTRGQNCRIFCFRVYGRKMEQSEIAANYAVDKARFGLQ